jgi:nitrite reductase/ring-hydroxylating ferredoxin subunit
MTTQEMMDSAVSHRVSTKRHSRRRRSVAVVLLCLMAMVTAARTNPIKAWTTSTTTQHRIVNPSAAAAKRSSSLQHQSRRRRGDLVRVYNTKRDDSSDTDESRGSTWRDLLPFGKDETKDDDKNKRKENNSGVDENPLGIAMGWIWRIKDGSDGSQEGEKNESQEDAIKEKQKQQRKKELMAAKQKVKSSSSKKEAAASTSSSTKEKDEDSTATKLLETLSSIKTVFSAMMSRGDDGDNEKGKEQKKRKQDLQSSPLSVVQKLFQSDEEEWVTVFPKTRIMPGQQVPVTVAGIDLLVVASNDGRNRLYCIANACPHLGTPLETGQLVRLPAVESSSSSASSGSASSKNRSNSSTSRSKTTTTQQQSVVVAKQPTRPNQWTELEVSSILQQDGCENCIVCPLHRTAFALESGEVRGEWCPYPPIIGKMVGIVKEPTPVATFDIRTKGKDVQVRINSPLVVLDSSNATDGS